MIKTLQISKANTEAETKIFENIRDCIDKKENFLFDAGAGSGKTYSLVQSLSYILATKIDQLRTHNQKI